MQVSVEICVEGVCGAVAAAAGGADRVELCADLAVGGLTPEPGDVAETCRLLNIPVHVLIRPRAGDFVYSQDELAELARDLAMARALGASGVVLGVNRADGTLDVPLLVDLVAQARPLSVTVHKAFDVLRDPLAALDELAQLGVDRVLTSGQAATAREGLPLLVDLLRKGHPRPVIMAGGRIRETDLPALLAAGLREIHIGSAAMTGGQTVAAQVRRLVERVRALQVVG